MAIHMLNMHNFSVYNHELLEKKGDRQQKQSGFQCLFSSPFKYFPFLDQ